MAQSHREASRRLFEFAEQQQGFFTTKQAKAAGFAENTHPYHVQVGNWIRADLEPAGRELDPGAPRYLPARSVSDRGSARPRALGTVVPEPERGSRGRIQPPHGAQPLRSVGSESSEPSHDRSD